MHQIRFRLRFLPRLRWGAYSAPRPLAGFKAPTSKGREGREGKGRGEGGEGRIRKKERGGRGKGNGGESVSLALILQFDHWLCVCCRSRISSVAAPNSPTGVGPASSSSLAAQNKGSRKSASQVSIRTGRVQHCS